MEIHKQILISENIIEELEKDLDALPHHKGIVVTSGGVMPPDTPIDKIKDVSNWVHRYPARF